MPPRATLAAARPAVPAHGARESRAPGEDALGSVLSRGRVLSGAAKVFAARGGSSSTVEDILRASDVSRRTFYKMFSGKESVLSALFDLATTLLVERLRGGDRKASPVEQLERAIDGYLDFNRTSGDLMRVLEAESLRPDSPLAARRAETLGTLERFFSQQIERALGVEVEPFVTYGLLMALEGVSRRLHEQGTPTEHDILRARAAMLRISFATLGAAAGGLVPALPTAKRR